MNDTQPNDKLSGASLPQRTIGYVASCLTDRNSSTVWEGVMDVAREHNVNVISFFPRDLDTPDGFDAQANVLYDLVNVDMLDGLVIWTTNLVNYAGTEGVKRVLARYRSVPIVAIEKGGPEDIPLVYIDSYQSMREEVLHLVKGHGYRRIAFIRGPDKTHVGAQERYQAYLDILSEHDLPFDSNLVSPPSAGSWGPEVGEEAIALLLDQRHMDVEAVVAANDNIAMGAMQALQARGIHVPDQVAVVGFDDQAGSNSIIPPLTTMSLQGYEHGRQATQMLLTLLEGGQVPERVTVPPQLVIRQSCGCVNPAVVQAATGPVIAIDQPIEELVTARREETLSQLRQMAGTVTEGLDPGWAGQLLEALLAELNADKPGTFLSTLNGVLRQVIAVKGQVETWTNVISVLRRCVLPYLSGSPMLPRAEELWLQAQVMVGVTAQQAERYQALQLEQQTQILNEIRTALITTFDVNDLMDILASELPRLGIPGCYLSLYEHSERPAEMSRLVLAYDRQHGRLDLQAGKQVFPSPQLMPEGMLSEDRRYSLVTEALYFREEQLGFVLFEVGPREGQIYDMLRSEISSALMGALLVEKVEVRANQLDVAAKVSSVASSILEPNELIQQTVQLVRERFGLYYVGLFLLDATGQNAVLQAGTGEAGKQMLARSHQLEVGGDSMIGWCIANKQARIALDVGEEAARFNNPLLPETRSELALPLISRGQVIGAMTVQSERETAFTQEDITILQTMADQLANAIANSQLFEQAQHRAVELSSAREIAEAARNEAEKARREAEAEKEAAEAAKEDLLKLNEKITQASYKLRELDWMKDQFVANVSYALRTPQAVIKLYLSLLERGKPEKQVEYMQILRREVGRLELMIEDLLDLSKIDQGRLSLEIVPVDLKELLGQILSDRIIQVEENGLTLKYKPTDDLPKAMADSTALRQVVPNLLTNAVNYTPAGGLVIATTAVQKRDGIDWVTFTIKDTGPGISSSDLPHIFERFYRGEAGRKAQTPGAGLGLAIVKEIVERLGGQISVESKPERGAAFTVWLKPAA